MAESELFCILGSFWPNPVTKLFSRCGFWQECCIKVCSGPIFLISFSWARVRSFIAWGIPVTFWYSWPSSQEVQKLTGIRTAVPQEFQWALFFLWSRLWAEATPMDNWKKVPKWVPYATLKQGWHHQYTIDSTPHSFSQNTRNTLPCWFYGWGKCFGERPCQRVRVRRRTKGNFFGSLGNFIGLNYSSWRYRIIFSMHRKDGEAHIVCWDSHLYYRSLFRKCRWIIRLSVVSSCSGKTTH